MVDRAKHQAFKKKYFTPPTKPLDFDGAYGGQCVDIPKAYRKEVYGVNCGSFNGAACKANEQTFPGATRLQAGPTVALQQGDVVIFAKTPGNPYGHVAVVDLVYANGWSGMEQRGAYTYTDASGKTRKVP